MIRFVLITVVFASQAFGHKGMLREKEALEAAHERAQVYTPKPGCSLLGLAEERNNFFKEFQAFVLEAPVEAREPIGNLLQQVSWTTPLIAQIPNVARYLNENVEQFQALAETPGDRQEIERFRAFLADIDEQAPLNGLLARLERALPYGSPALDVIRQLRPMIPQDVTVQTLIGMVQGTIPAGPLEPLFEEIRARSPVDINITPVDLGLYLKRFIPQDSPEASPASSGRATPVNFGRPHMNGPVNLDLEGEPGFDHGFRFVPPPSHYARPGDRYQDSPEASPGGRCRATPVARRREFSGSAPGFPGHPGLRGGLPVSPPVRLSASSTFRPLSPRPPYVDIESGGEEEEQELRHLPQQPTMRYWNVTPPPPPGRDNVVSYGRGMVLDAGESGFVRATLTHQRARPAEPPAVPPAPTNGVDMRVGASVGQPGEDSGSLPRMN